MAVKENYRDNPKLKRVGIEVNFTKEQIPYIAEVNPDKFGSYTPGTWIPIIPEEELLARKPDYLIILPWHFKKFFENPQLSTSSITSITSKTLI